MLSGRMSPPSVASPIMTASLKPIGAMFPLVLMYFMSILFPAEVILLRFDNVNV
jgi:hypothetical protein